VLACWIVLLRLQLEAAAKVATPAEKPRVCKFNGFRLLTSLKAMPGFKGPVVGLTNIRPTFTSTITTPIAVKHGFEPIRAALHQAQRSEVVQRLRHAVLSPKG